MDDRAGGRRGPPPDWQEVHRILDPDTAIVIQVLQNKNSNRPQFSMSIGKQLSGDEHVGRRLPVFLEFFGNGVRLKHDVPSIVHGMTMEAANWIEEEVKRLNDEYRARKEQERFNRHEPAKKVMREGKTSRKRERRAARKAKGNETQTVSDVGKRGEA